MRTIMVPLTCLFLLGTGATAPAQKAVETERGREYIHAVTRGAGLLPWQEKAPSAEEAAFRMEIEKRKDEMLATRVPVQHPVMITGEEFARARRNIASTTWAKEWFDKQKEAADYVLAQPDGYIEAMISELTPGHMYGFTCPNCVNVKSQEGAGGRIIDWDYRNPDQIRCRQCGQTYPDAKYPETAVLDCPRMGQKFAYYLNEAERNNPDDRSGKHAWRWVGRPMHMSFSGIIRQQKNAFMISAMRDLAVIYQLTGDSRYAEKAAAILDRFAHCYRNWLFHDYWCAIADCDPIYAAFHHNDLKLDWKRHLSEEAFKDDDLERAGMLQNYWGAGRYYPTTDSVTTVSFLCTAYDLVYNATGPDGRPLWDDARRARVERDLILEWIMGSENFVGGPGEASENNNKAPRVYQAHAAVGKCLGVTNYADTAYRGYEAVRDKSFLYDGFSRESPGYTNMYLSSLLAVPDTLNGFRWPAGYKREGVVNLFETDAQLRLMLYAYRDNLRPNGQFVPLQDTFINGDPNRWLIELGVKHYPEHYAGLLPVICPNTKPSEFAVFNLDASETQKTRELDLPEIFFPAWMVAFLRNGNDANASLATLNLAPPGGHRQNDSLGLYYFTGGMAPLGELGYLGDLPASGWVGSSSSHNLVLVDRNAQGTHIPALQLFATSPHITVTEATSQVYKQCSEYRRRVIMVKGPEGRSFLIDIFRVKGGKQHNYRLFSEIGSSDSDKGSRTFQGLTIPTEGPLPKYAPSIRREDRFGIRDIRTDSAPPASWQAVWSEPGRGYRLWMLSPSESVEAGHGPGQEEITNPGRRVRYIDVIRRGDDLNSTFVAVHEPGYGDGEWIIDSIDRLETPDSAGPEAVALKIQSKWGEYLVLNDFAARTKVGDAEFEGRVGVLCKSSEGPNWLFSAEAATLKQNTHGFENKTASWSGSVANNTETELNTPNSRPSDWQDAEGCQSYLIAHDGNYQTGFPAAGTEANRIQTTRFPLQPIKEFKLPAVRYETWSSTAQVK